MRYLSWKHVLGYLHLFVKIYPMPDTSQYELMLFANIVFINLLVSNNYYNHLHHHHHAVGGWKEHLINGQFTSLGTSMIILNYQNAQLVPTFNLNIELPMSNVWDIHLQPQQITGQDASHG